MKYTFVVNPKAGDKDNEKIVREEISKLSFKDDCVIYLTKGNKDATRYVKEYLDNHKGEELVFVACGGDGTISEVFNGVVGYDNVSVTCYPCGSGNDLVKTFGGEDKFKDLEKLLLSPSTKIDLLKVKDRYSVNVINFGFDTTVAIQVNEDRDKTGKGSKSSYTKGIIKAIIKSMKNKFKVYADGELLNPEGVGLLCTIGNGQYVGGSFKCAPRARVDDGLMEVCFVKTLSRFMLGSMIGTYTKGEHLDNEKMKKYIVYRQARKVKVEAPEGFAYSLDGEIIYDNDFEIEIVDKALNFKYIK